MKKSQLRQIIKEEIHRVLNENEFESFLNSLNIGISQKTSDRGIDIGSDVAVIKYGQGVVVDIDDENQKYVVNTSKGKVTVPFNFVQPIKVTGEDLKLLKQIKELEKEHKQFVRTFISNLADFNSSNYKEDFKDEQWKLSSIAKFYLDLGQQMWDMFKENYDYITHSDEFEDLFLDILGMLKTFQKYDKGMNDDLDNIIQIYEKIGDKIGAGVKVK